MGSGIALDFGMSSFSPPWAGNVPAAVNSTQTFGPLANYGSDGGSKGSLLAALNPLNAFGLTVLSGVIAFAALLIIRHTLPA